MSIFTGDCLKVMATFDAESIDAIVTDPPYGLEFMGKEWDKLSGQPGYNERGRMTPASSGLRARKGFREMPNSYQAGKPMQEWHEAWAREAFRVAKPGAHLLAFGGTRTVHRMTAAIEDAGWEIRDMLVWAYASGFPKSLDVSKAIDKQAGVEREVVGEVALNAPGGSIGDTAYNNGDGRYYPTEPRKITAPATPDAAKWNGWGTALKPAWEPIVLARKPLRGTVAANVLRHGTGALNIAATRIGTEAVTSLKGLGQNVLLNDDGWSGIGQRPEPTTSIGRWPANVILTDPIFDGGVEGVVGGGEASYNPSGVFGSSRGGTVYANGAGIPPGADVFGYGDAGSYSRFFLIAKAGRSDREPVAARYSHAFVGGGYEDPDLCAVVGCADVRARHSERFNTHPTVKPLDLMRHLVRLVTPPGGTVLDPFLGSGTTAIAAEMEGFAWVGIEREAEYVAIAEARLNGTQRGLGLVG